MGSPPLGGTFWLLICIIFFNGCYRVYKPVYIPTKCQIPKLERPALGSSSLAQNIKALLIYTELLEKDLEFCRVGKSH
ncbi:hypothetical protein [Helicobacter felis]|nr:hypothetical protein [Helicobacter felis]